MMGRIVMSFVMVFSICVLAHGADIAFTTPQEEGAVTGVVRLEVTVDASLGEAAVNYYLDLPAPPEVPKDWEKYVIGGSNFAPFSLSWDATNVPEGRHVITAVAYLKEDRTVFATVTVVVQAAK